jgi:hypothetical protein
MKLTTITITALSVILLASCNSEKPQELPGEKYDEIKSASSSCGDCGGCGIDHGDEGHVHEEKEKPHVENNKKPHDDHAGHNH